MTKTADKTTAAPGDVITYTVDVAPNVTREDLAYTITDTLPEGSTYVEGSATNGARYEDGVVSWIGDVESTYGDQGDYTIRTNKQDPSCTPPIGDGYLDLAALEHPGQRDITGDSVAFTAFADGTFGFYGDYYQGLTFTDDGFLVYGDNYDPTVDEGYTVQQVPDTTRPNNVAALLWQDMELRYDESGAGVSLADTTGAAAVRRR